MAGRPKGYMLDWTPTPEVAEVIGNAKAVLSEYGGYGPMTVRQIFYRLVGQYGYPKDERAYKRLAEYLVKARRSRRVPFRSIRDDGTVAHAAGGTTSRADVWKYLKGIISRPDSYLRLDRNTDQPHHIELWCEAAGMAPMLSQMVRHRDVTVYSTGGFSSVTVTYEVAQRIARRDKPTYFLHIGDFDPSGESIFTSMSQDIGSFVASEFGATWNPHTGLVYGRDGSVDERFFIPERVALTEDQVAEYDLPTAPPKGSDSRSANWIGETTQAEALPPDLLEQIVRGKLDELTDADILADVEAREAADERRLLEAVTDLSVADIIEREGLTDPSLLEVVDAIAERDMA